MAISTSEWVLGQPIQITSSEGGAQVVNEWSLGSPVVVMVKEVDEGGLTSAVKRQAVAGGLPWSPIYPRSDGRIDSRDRRQVAGVYPFGSTHVVAFMIIRQTVNR